EPPQQVQQRFAAGADVPDIAEQRQRGPAHAPSSHSICGRCVPPRCRAKISASISSLLRAHRLRDARRTASARDVSGKGGNVLPVAGALVRLSVVACSTISYCPSVVRSVGASGGPISLATDTASDA